MLILNTGEKMIPIQFGIIGSRSFPFANLVKVMINYESSEPLPWCRRANSSRYKIDWEKIKHLVKRDTNNTYMVFLSRCTDYWYVFDKFVEIRRKIGYRAVTPFITRIPLVPRVVPSDWIVYVIDKTLPIQAIDTFLKYNPDIYPLIHIHENEKIDPRYMKNLEKIIRRQNKVIVTSHRNAVDESIKIVDKLQDSVDEILVDGNICKRIAGCRIIEAEVLSI